MAAYTVWPRQVKGRCPSFEFENNDSGHSSASKLWCNSSIMFMNNLFVMFACAMVIGASGGCAATKNDLRSVGTSLEDCISWDFLFSKEYWHPNSTWAFSGNYRSPPRLGGCEVYPWEFGGQCTPGSAWNQTWFPFNACIGHIFRICRLNRVCTVHKLQLHRAEASLFYLDWKDLSLGNYSVGRYEAN